MDALQGLLGWLGDILRNVTSIIPRVFMIDETIRGIRLRRGRNPELLEPGIYGYVPMFTKIWTIPVKRQSFRIPPQVLTSKEGTPIVVGAVVAFRVHDPVKAAINIHNLDETVHEVARAIIPSVVVAHTFKDLLKNLASESFGQLSPLDELLTESARVVLAEFGIEVEYARITNFAKATVIRNISEASSLILPSKPDQAALD